MGLDCMEKEIEQRRKGSSDCPIPDTSRYQTHKSISGTINNCDRAELPLSQKSSYQTLVIEFTLKRLLITQNELNFAQEKELLVQLIPYFGLKLIHQMPKNNFLLQFNFAPNVPFPTHITNLDSLMPLFFLIYGNLSDNISKSN